MLLSNIECNTIFLKANTTIGEGSLIQGALSNEDLEHVSNLISNMKIEYFNCGHGIHTEKAKQFIRCINKTLKN